MKHSDTIAKISDALVGFQSEIVDPKKDENGVHNSKYVTLDNLIQTVRPILAKHGLGFIQSPSGNGASVTITTTLIHKSGEWIESDPFTLQVSSTRQDGAQAAGSAVTYGRRYTLQSILGIACDNDDDGELASQKPQDRAGSVPYAQPYQVPAQEQNGAQNANLMQQTKKRIFNKANAKGIDMKDIPAVIHYKYGREDYDHLTLGQACELANKLEEYVKEMKAAN